MSALKPEQLETGELYLFAPDAGGERIWGLFDATEPGGRIRLEVASRDFEHFDLRIVLPDGWRAVRAASRNELRDFAFNWGYARR
ncbi:hypothetical protein [uncultured Alistipes sp.]|uniref:hypothetical protein n=1 Tax=uncultured Alistipes sp. TaxID=538949 RepID=UPI0025DA7C25|nr:hypothetical protein [uncultured Alistipes sp.]